MAQHQSAEQRRAQASSTLENLNLDSRFLVDSMDNAVWQQYGAAPSAAYVLDLQGKIYLRQPWVYPKEIRRALNEILAK